MSLQSLLLSLCSLLLLAAFVAAEDQWVVYEGKAGPGVGKHIVLVSGDDEYRSEEALPQLGKILAKHYGFKCTVLFPIDPATGEIKPDFQKNIPGLEALKTADLLMIGLRFRNLPDEQMQYFDDYVKAGKPIVALRTSTHAFNGLGGKFASWNDTPTGFGRRILGEKWVAHHGAHGSEATRGVTAPGQEASPILRGIKEGDIFGPTDVYTVTIPLPGDSQPVVLGQVVAGMKFDSPPLVGKKNEPMMPVAWTKTYEVEGGKKGKVFTTTMGAATDLSYEGTRRMVVNACLWAVGIDVPAEGAKVDLVGVYEPSKFSFGGYKKGVKPADHAWKE